MNPGQAYEAFDKKQFELVFNSHYARLCAFANSYIRDQASAEEIVQDVFVKLWQKKNTLDPTKSIQSYLFTSVKNRCLNHIRDNKKFRSYFLDVEIELAVEDQDPLGLEETQDRIEKAFSKLPPRCREIFEMSRFEEMKYKVIAEKLDLSVKTVEVQMSKALRILREELGDLLIWFLILWILR